ncbi:hypothetical protein DENSPDRAFT_886011 [Dentipellis sp. KUC8613]|nr:hypothetical protein DENSPDRAFT_886011 [Dentipellis sp. KUC8613]
MPRPAISHPTAPSGASAAPSHASAVSRSHCTVSRSHCAVSRSHRAISCSHRAVLFAAPFLAHRTTSHLPRAASPPPLAGALLRHLSPHAAVVRRRNVTSRPLLPHLCRSAALATGFRVSAAPPSAPPESLVPSRRHLAPLRHHTCGRAIVPPSMTPQPPSPPSFIFATPSRATVAPPIVAVVRLRDDAPSLMLPN